MELLHSNKNVCSGFQSHEHDKPTSFSNTDFTKMLFKAISKSNLQENVRVHILEKFFEELGNCYMEATETKNTLCSRDIKKDHSELLHAATLCAQALSSSRVNDKVRFQFLSNLLVCLGDDNMETKLCCPMEAEQAAQVQELNSVTSAQKKQAQDSSLRILTEGSVHENQQRILSFLFNAVAHGALVLKDVESVLHCMRDSSMESWREENNTHNNEGQVQIYANSTEHGGRKITHTEHEQVDIDGRREECTKCSKGREEPLCPMDNTPQVITQEPVLQVSSKASKSSLSLVNGRGEGQHGLHVSHSMADGKDKELHTQPQARTLNSCSVMPSTKGDYSLLGISDKGVKEGNLHVINSLPLFSTMEKTSKFLNTDGANSGFPEIKHGRAGNHVYSTQNSLNFLEAAKFNLKNSSDKDSHQMKDYEGKRSQSNSHGFPIFKIDHNVLHQKMEMCRFSVLGKITLAKGDEPWTGVKLKEKLDLLWGFNSQWRLISLGRGFFHIILSNQEEHDRVWNKEILHLKPGVLRVQRWTFGFNPYSEKTPNAQVWFRIHHLPWCLWDASTISGIARQIGEPLRIDKTTLEGNVGHYARVLIEVDLSKPIISSILVDFSSQVIEVQLSPENIPSLCRGCNSIGHTAKDCRMLLRMEKNTYSSKSAHEHSKIGAFSSDVKTSKRSAQQSEWRKKKIHVTGKENIRKAETSGQKQVEIASKGGPVQKLNSLKTTTEMITDFGAQREALFTDHKSPNGFLSDNQFSILSELDGMNNEDIIDGNVFNEENPCSTHIINCTENLQTEVAVPQFNTIEDSTMDNSKFDDAERVLLSTKLPEKWGDLLDEEDEIDRVSLPIPRRDISEIREGLKTIFMERPIPEMDLVETDHSLFNDDPARPIMPMSIHKDKKVKIGFRNSKRSTCSSKF